MRVLIDGDTLCYRAAFSKEATSISGVCGKLDELVTDIFDEMSHYFKDYKYTIYPTGSNNFRKEITKDYKAQRPKERPKFLGLARDYLDNNYDTVITDGEEADDAIAIEATKTFPNVVIVSIDKGFKQVPCQLYNPNKQEWDRIDSWNGLKFFYTQLLVGDTADNIKGVAGIGPKRAEVLLDGATTELEMWERCLKAYDGDDERAVMNGRLLWLRRQENQMWTPPVG